MLPGRCDFRPHPVTIIVLPAEVKLGPSLWRCHQLRWGCICQRTNDFGLSERFFGDVCASHSVWSYWRDLFAINARHMWVFCFTEWLCRSHDLPDSQRVTWGERKVWWDSKALKERNWLDDWFRLCRVVCWLVMHVCSQSFTVDGRTVCRYLCTARWEMAGMCVLMPDQKSVFFTLY